MGNNSCFKCIVNPPSHDKLHGTRVILIGDAGHSVTSTLGQGCNAALESCTVFDEVRVHAVGIHLAPPPLRLLIQPDLPPTPSADSARSPPRLKVMESCGGDLDRAPSLFTKARLREVHALQTLDYIFAIARSPTAARDAPMLHRCVPGGVARD